MKKFLSRAVSFLLTCSIVLALIPAVTPVKVQAVTQNQQNIVDRANYFYDTTWVCQKTIQAWRDETVFEAGQIYRLPYGQPVNSGAFIGYGVTLEDFLIAAADIDSVFYAKQSEFNGWTSAYYATDCAAFVAMCWGTVRQDCSTLPYYSTNMGVVSLANLSKIQLGDALDSTTVGHVVLVTDLTYDESGNLVEIEITEQTPPQLKRSYFTPEGLVEKYGGEFYIYRYYGTVPEAPVRGYITECQQLAAYCDIEITADMTVMSLPCGQEVDAESVALTTVAAGESYVATRLYKNTAGELWYRISLGAKDEGYIPAEHTLYQGQIISDISLENATAPSAHIKGKTFAVNGSINALHNSLTNASVYIYKGFGISGTPVTGGQDAVSSNSYSLANSNIDYATSFGTIGVGQYTYVIDVTYQNYYATSKDTYEKNTGKVELMQEYFYVLSSSVNQGSCTHKYTTTVISESSCVQQGITVQACGTCGLVNKQVLEADGHSYGQWQIIVDATCTEEGSQSCLCDTCGNLLVQSIPAKGHRYEAYDHSGDCQNYAHTTYICGACGDSYVTYAEELMSPWQMEMPDVAGNLVESKVQYRYRDYEITTSQASTLEGWDLVESAWNPAEQGAVYYVAQWPSGFDTSNSLFAEYDNIGEIVADSETESSKVTVDSDAVVGYLYYHWCSNSDRYRYSYANKTSTHTIFHAYYSTVSPSSYTCDTSDMSYKTSHSCCTNSNSQWFFVVEVRCQKSTSHEKVYTYERWTHWSEWSDAEVVQTQTRQVETQTLYRYVDGVYGDHDYVDDVCTVCGDVILRPQPILRPAYATVSFEGQIQLNIYYTASDLGDVSLEDMGLLVWQESNPEGTIEDAAEIISGAATDGSQYMVHTNGIPAKKLGDTVYFKIYVKLADGSYLYTDMLATSPKNYAMSIINNDGADEKIKSLCVAMLNYGAAAQVYFDYRADSLLNGDLTAQQQALVDSYNPEMMDAVVGASAEKASGFVRQGFSRMYPTVSFEGAFAINYYFENSFAAEQGMTFYYWNAKTYEAVEVLTADNATGTMEMVRDGHRYWGEVANIAAKEMDSTIYVVGVYTSGGVAYTTGVISCSLGSYCEGIAGNAASDARELASMTAVYGYYAERYFTAE